MSRVALVVAVVAISAPSWAAPVSIIDSTLSGASVDGVISPGEYGGLTYFESGVGGSFRDSFGAGSKLYFDSDLAKLYVGIEMAGNIGGPGDNSSNDIGVIYLDTPTPGGLTSTAGIAGGAGKKEESAIAGGPTAADPKADLTFAPGFAFTHAITFSGSRFTGLYVIDQSGANPSIGFVDGGFDDGFVFNNIVESRASSDFRVRELSIPLSVLGLTPGDELRYAGSVVNGLDVYRSNELFGVAQSTIDGVNNDGFNNIAAFDFSLNSGDFSSFTTAVPEPTALSSSAILGVLAGLYALCCGRTAFRGVSRIGRGVQRQGAVAPACLVFRDR